jgi:hypothetical protein
MLLVAKSSTPWELSMLKNARENAFQNVACLTLFPLMAGNHSNARQGRVLTQTDIVDPGQGYMA